MRLDMCVDMCVAMCADMCLHTRLHMRLHTRLHARLHTRLHARLYARLHARLRTCLCTGVLKRGRGVRTLMLVDPTGRRPAPRRAPIGGSARRRLVRAATCRRRLRRY